MTGIELKGKTDEEKVVNLLKSGVLHDVYNQIVHDIVKRNNEGKYDTD